MVYTLLALVSMCGALGLFIASIAVRHSSLLWRRRLMNAGLLLMAATFAFLVVGTSNMLAELS